MCDNKSMFFYVICVVNQIMVNLCICKEHSKKQDFQDIFFNSNFPSMLVPKVAKYKKIETDAIKPTFCSPPDYRKLALLGMVWYYINFLMLNYNIYVR